MMETSAERSCTVAFAKRVPLIRETLETAIGPELAGALEKVSEGRRSQDYMLAEIEARRPQLERWETLCHEMGERPADVALAWLLHQPAVTAPIIGPRTEEQLLGSMRALHVHLSDEVLEAIDLIFPSTGGPAPEAYAW